MNQFEREAAALKEQCRQRKVARAWAAKEVEWLLRTTMRRRWKRGKA